MDKLDNPTTNNDQDFIEKLIDEAVADCKKMKKAKTKPTKKPARRRLIGFVGGYTDEPMVRQTKHKIGFGRDSFNK